MKDKKKLYLKMPSAFTVLFLLMIAITTITQFIPAVKSVQLSDLIMAPINGMVGVRNVELHNEIEEARINEGVYAALDVLKESEQPLINVWNIGRFSGGMDVALFVIVIGGFLGVVTKTGALDASIGALVKHLKGRELLLIALLMFSFSLGGTTYGMAEETLAFYTLILVTMMKAGFDPMVAVGTIMLGSAMGVLGSTVNPFAVGAAVAAAESAGTEINQAIVMITGVALWLTMTGIAIWYVLQYAKKVHNNPAASMLSKSELEEANKAFLTNDETVIELTTKRKVVLGLFTLSFVIMVISVIPWNNFGINIFDNTAWLTGSSLGSWWFPELTIWFFLTAVAIGVVYGLSEKDLVSSFISGASEMIGVAFIIGISRGISFMMANTGLDLYILEQASYLLSGVSSALFAIMAYIIYIGLTFLIPSTSGLATVSMPIFAPLAERLGIAPEIVISAFTAGSGLVGVITPTSGVLMGGLLIAKVNYGTWIKFVSKFLALVFIATVIILSITSIILS